MARRSDALNRFAPRGAIFVLSLAALMAAGCRDGAANRGGAGSMKSANDLKAIGLMYHEYYTATNKAPEKAADLQPYASRFPEAYKALVEGQHVFIYGVKLTGMLEGNAYTVIGYEKDAASKGGYVLFGDGSVRPLTADEFKKQPMAKPPQ